MFQTALRWMGARWWAAAAMAAIIIVFFRISAVDAPSSAFPHSSGYPDVHAARMGAGTVDASFRKSPSAPETTDADLEFLALRNELVDLKRSLRISEERAALYSESYENVTRQYGEISGLAALLMEEAEEERTSQTRTPDERALVERAVVLMKARAQALNAVATHAAAHPASASTGASNVPMPTEAIFIRPARDRSDSQQ